MRNNDYLYVVIADTPGCEDRYECKTYKEVIDSCDYEENIVLREGKPVTKSAVVECYDLDIQDLRESLKTAVKHPENLRARVRAFVNAYRDCGNRTEIVQLSPTVRKRLHMVAEHLGKTDEECISFLLRPYFTSLIE